MRVWLLLPVLALFLAVSAPSHAVMPDEILDDPALEARARVISKDIRCLVCQNQSIDDSNADLARDLRIIVRERLVAGDSNDQVKDFLVDRYGDYVLLTPPMRAGTLVLWVGPFVLVGVALTFVFFWFRARNQGAAAPATSAGTGLSEAERRRLKELLGDDGPDRPAAG